MITRIAATGMCLALILSIIVYPAGAQPHPPYAGSASDPISTGMTGDASRPGKQGQPGATCPAGGQCFADVLPGSGFYDFVNRIYWQGLVTGYACGGPGEPCDPEGRPYYRPGATVTRQQMAKFIDNARRLPEIHIETETHYTPIYVSNTNTTAIEVRTVNGIGLSSLSINFAGVEGTSDTGIGVYGQANSGDGINGASHTGRGVQGVSDAGIGVEGFSDANTGVEGASEIGAGVNGGSVSGNGVVGFNETGTGYGVLGYSAGNRAGLFLGNVQVTGNLSKGAGSFKIDHPLDPANKYLYHSFVESPDMLNIYRGTVALDSEGEARVTMPDWFEALNRDFDYQLTAVGAPGPDLYIAEEIAGNSFKIAGGAPNSKASWQVTGTRHDPYANANRIPVEEDKTPDERGTYLHPTEWGQPESLGVNYEKQQQIEGAAQDRNKP
jgi:hypothetical protein